MDLVLNVDRFPEPGETISAAGLNFFPGGKGANQSVAIGRLGGEVKMIGRVGEDDHGRELLATLERDHVDTSRISALPGISTGMAFIAIDEHGQNQIIINAGANGALSPQDLEIDFDALRDGMTHYLTQLEIPLESVIKGLQLARSAGLITILNPAPARYATEIREVLKLVDILVLNETETKRIGGSFPETIDEALLAAQHLRELGPRSVVITLGPRGCVLVDDEHKLHIPAPEVEVVDTTAAGDAHIGAFCARLMQGDSVPECLAYANVAGAFTVTRNGAQPSLPTVDDLAISNVI